jgi:ATP-dependent Clp endopeptidase proteolytic subunit ClpP
MEIYNLLINKDIGTDKGEISAEYVRNQIDSAKKINAGEIKLIINSRGGSVYEGFSIYNDLKDAGIKVTAYIHGFCGSIATLIASASEYVEMSETAQYMIHNASGGAQGTASEIESTAEALKQIDTILAQNYSKKTKKSIEDIKVLMDKTTYMTPQEAKSLGFVDAVRMPVAAFGNFNPNIKMKKENNKGFNAKLASAFKAIEEALTGAEPKNFVEPLADGMTIVYGDGELEVGKEAYLDEAMTEHAPEGEHALAAGKIIVVDAAGVIIEIRDIEAAATEPTEPTEAEAKVAELTAQVDALVAEITALKEEKEIVETASADFKAKMEKEFKALKSTITNAGISITDKAPAHNKTNKSAFDSFAEKKRNDYK